MFKEIKTYKKCLGLFQLSLLVLLLIFQPLLKVYAAEDNLEEEGEETILISELPVDSKVYDPKWEWEFRTGNNYTYIGEDETRDGDETRPVIWIVAAHNHNGFPDNDNMVTLVAAEPLARYPFGITRADTDWGKSKLRSFLHNDFFNSFSREFKRGVINTGLSYWDSTGLEKTSKDRIFILTLKEMGESAEDNFDAGLPLEIFQEGFTIAGTFTDKYWTRSVTSTRHEEKVIIFNENRLLSPESGDIGVIPALNMRNDVEVIETLQEGLYELARFPIAPGDANGDGEINVTDAITVLRHIVGLINIAEDYGEEAYTMAQVSDDDSGELSVTDAILILRHLVGLITFFPVEAG